MKKLSIAFAATFMLSTAAPVMAAEVDLTPVEQTCLEKVQATYGSANPVHAVLLSPLYLAHAILCHVFHKNG